jgi:hypothetical protein
LDVGRNISRGARPNFFVERGRVDIFPVRSQEILKFSGGRRKQIQYRMMNILGGNFSENFDFKNNDDLFVLVRQQFFQHLDR